MNIALAPGQRLIRGMVGRKLNNALTMTFEAGPEQIIATALQSGGDGAGAKLGVLFGFKNGGPGTHLLTATDGSSLKIASRQEEPTVIRDGDGTQVAIVERGDTSTVRLADGTPVLTVVASPEGAKSNDAFRMHVLDAGGAKLGELDIVRTAAGWSLGMELLNDAIWFGHAGQPLRIPLLGTRIVLDRDPTPVELQMLLAISVDMAIGVRAYVGEMRDGFS